MDAPAVAAGPLSVATGGALSLDAEEPRRLARRIADRVSLNPQGVLRSYRDDGHHAVRSYAWLWDQAGHVAAALSAAGAAPGSFVIVLVDDIVDFFPAFWGALRGGFIPVALMSVAREASYRGDDAFTQAVGLLADPFFIVDEFFAGLRLEPEVRRAERTVRLGSIVPPAVPWVDFPDVVDPAYLVATSGSTGRPKLVALSNSAVLYRNFAKSGAGASTEPEWRGCRAPGHDYRTACALPPLRFLDVYPCANYAGEAGCHAGRDRGVRVFDG